MEDEFAKIGLCKNQEGLEYNLQSSELNLSCVGSLLEGF